MRILELGNYIVPAYAGMILAEQGHDVVKWHNDNDPILSLHQGAELWRWINDGKALTITHPTELNTLPSDAIDIVLENFRPSTLTAWGLCPEELAVTLNVRWIAMRSEEGDTSFDVLAQCRAWRHFAPWMPFYIGDTAAGLWMAFKALASADTGYYELGHASCLRKLVEGELLDGISRDTVAIPWETDPYRCDEDGAYVEYKGRVYREPVRDLVWQREHLRHIDGRITI